MSESIYTRTEMLLGTAAMEKLRRSTVAVFGVGGVGSYAAEALVRSGVGKLILVDGDVVVPSNLNRQLIAAENTVGMMKTEAAALRLKSINPKAEIVPVQLFFTEESAGRIDLSGVDYIADAIDTVTSKIYLICLADRLGIPIVSSMGAGGKLDPSMLRAADIYSTKVCPLARVMRRELRARGIKHLRVVYSEEMPYSPPDAPAADMQERVGDTAISKKRPPASAAFVPGAAGLLMASEIVRGICGI